MQRIKHPSTVTPYPTPVETGNTGYFSAGDPSTDTPPTTITAAWANRVQEEICSVIQGAGLELDGDDNGQLWHVLRHIQALRSGSEETAATTPHNKAVLASQSSVASGARSVVVASDLGQAIGDYSVVAASGGWTYANGDRSAAIASYESVVDAMMGAAIATTAADVKGTTCAVIASDGAGTSAGTTNALTVASKNFVNDIDNSIAGGWAASGPADTANRTWLISSQGGHASFAGTLVANGIIDSGADYAELFQNAEGQPIPVGRLVALDGESVRLAGEGDEPIGVVSPAPAVLGDAPQHWHGRYVRDEFGGYVLDEHGQKVVNPDYDPSRPYVRRQDRPTEWTVVGLMGKLFVAVDHTVQAGEYVRPGPDGIGTLSSEPTRIWCMKVTTPWDPARGYGVARCLVR